MKLILGDKALTLSDIRNFLEIKPQVELSPAVRERIVVSRQVIEKIISEGKTVYGVNTGFGKFAEVRIKKEQTAELQRRLVLSHAAGVGDPVPMEIARLILFLKIKNLSLGYSGARLRLVDLLLDILNAGIVPVIPQKGSVGASGDLAPLAHMALLLFGEGEAFIPQGTGYERVSGAEALNRFKLHPIELAAKEGLAVLNGTQAIQAYGLWSLVRAENLVRTADVIGAMTLEALLGTLTAFDDRIQSIRNHPGQLSVARNFRQILAKSPIVESHRFSDHKVQDAYSLRCIPQVHGAIRDALCHIREVFEREMNGVTDNPLVFADTDEVLSGGNFHGQPVAMAADYLAIIMAELASLSERRIEHMMDHTVSELPAFLVEDGGLNSGFMIAHVTAAALVSENKVLAHPSSVDSIPTSANKEDHVSMGTFAARKAADIIQNAELVLAVELLAATQALELRQPLKPAMATAAVLNELRKTVPKWESDRLMHRDIEAAVGFIRSGQIISVVEQICGQLI